MTTFADRFRFVAAVVVLAAVTTSAQTPEELARRRLESGRAFLTARNYVEALKDFEAVLQSYPTTAAADDALLEIATYQLQVARDLDAADTRIKQLLKVYPTSSSAAMALVLEGRVALARGRTPEIVSAAMASFDRVPRFYPGNEAIPAAMYYGGEAARLGGQPREAIQRFSALIKQFPNSPWTAKALLGSSVSLARSGQTARAMEQLQRVRNSFPATPESAVALDLNSVLHRLYVRAPASQPAFLFSGRSIPAAPGKLRDVTDIAVDRDDNVIVASNNSVVVYGAKDAPLRTLQAAEPSAVSFDRLGTVMTVHQTGLRLDGKTPVPLTMAMVNGKARELKAMDAVVTSSGEYLVADQEQKVILRFLADGNATKDFAARIVARRLAINDLDEVVALDKERKSVSLFSRDGALIKQIPERGTGYQLREPADVAFDQVGHIYVLDRTAVLVFSADASKLLATFTTKEKTPGAIGQAEELALDRAGRLYVFDSRSDTVKVYR
jgi:outer membrane protein assembly factor BamD (BamD/ComL family)